MQGDSYLGGNGLFNSIVFSLLSSCLHLLITSLFLFPYPVEGSDYVGGSGFPLTTDEGIVNILTTLMSALFTTCIAMLKNTLIISIPLSS